MNEVRVITPPGFFGASSDEHPLVTAMRVIGVGFGDDHEWCSKYGCDYENDVFLMKRYCWCERDDCAWCTGCAAFSDACSVCNEEWHAPDCYRRELRRRAGDALNSFDDRDDTIQRALCAERGIPFTPYLFHCDCGGEERRAAAVDTRGCDYAIGKGIFARFSPWTLDRSRDYYDPPNFWYKPTDFRVTWYKYIGRDMTANRDDVAGDFIERIFSTHPRGMTAQSAFDLFVEQQQGHDAAFTAMFR